MNIVNAKKENLSTRLSSALNRAKKRLSEVKAAQAAPEPLPGEVFIEQAQCGSTGQRYAIVWHRTATMERFTVHEIVKAKGGGNTSDLATQHETATGGDDRGHSYKLSEFDSTGRQCPWCGVKGGMIYCSCSKTICRSSVYMRVDLKYFEPYGCVCDAPLGTNATHCTGSAPDAHAAPSPKKAQAKIGHDKRKAISRSNKPLLPGRRK